MTPDIQPFSAKTEQNVHRMNMSPKAFQSVITYEDEHPDFRPLKHLSVFEDGKEYYIVEGTSSPRGEQPKTVTLRIDKEDGIISHIDEKEINQKIAA